MPSYTVFRLFPVNVNAEGRAECTCRAGVDCDRVGKHPLDNWSRLAPGETRFGSAGHGLVTGAKSGVFVVDTDGLEGDARFIEMCGGVRPDTYTVATPSGGRHYYFVAPPHPVRCSVKELAPSVDIRGDGGYVVLPGSPHESGRAYTVERNTSPCEAPVWLLEWPGLKGRMVESSGAVPVFPVDVTTDMGRARLELGRKACEEMPPSVSGENGSLALWNVALHLVRDLELPLDSAAELVSEVYNPRCSPPWSPNELVHKLEDARDKSERMPGNVTDVDLGSRLRVPTPAAPAKGRKRKDPAHRYECDLASAGNLQPSKTSVSNVLHILSVHPSWDGVLQYDAFRDRIVAVDPPIRLQAEKTCFVDRDGVSVRKWFEACGGLIVSKDLAWDAVVSVAQENAFHPVKEYLEGLPVEDPATLHLAARLFFGSDNALDAVLVRKFLVGAVRRILNPGEKVDTMLVLVGPQGAGKSTFVPTLFGSEFTSEDLADIKSKDAMIGLAGKWAIEVAELDKLLRIDPETVKAFITRCIDPYRAPYERVSTDHPRQCVYVGTTNKDDFLRDPTGERRYWIVDVSKGVDLANVRAWRDRLWSAAYQVALVDKYQEPHWLTDEEAAQLKERASAYKGENGWSDLVESYCAGREFVTVGDALSHLGVTSDKQHDQRLVNRVTDILRDLGCEKGVKHKGRQRNRVWFMPESLRSAEVPDREAARRQGEVLMQGLLKQ